MIAKNNKIEIYLPRVKKDALQGLMKLGKDDIKFLLEDLRRYLREHKAEIVESASKSVVSSFNALATSSGMPSLLKEEWASLYVSLSSNLKNIYNLAQGDPYLFSAWELILQSVEINSRTLSTILGRELYVAKPPYWTYHTYLEVFFSPLIILDSY